MKIIQIVGARPQFIKYFPVYKAIEKLNNSSNKFIENILVHTGQHYDYAMSEVFFKELGINKPKYHLEVGSSNHGFQTGLILQKVEEVLLKEKSDAIVVYGDTNSTLGGAIAAVKLHIPVVHIEAGLRNYNKYMPEEINRILTDHSSSLLLCPTKIAVDNLQKEGFEFIVNNGKLIRKFDFSHFPASLEKPLIVNVGDVMYDVLISALKIAADKSRILKDLNLTEKKYYVLTLHSAENTDNHESLEKIINFINKTASDNTVIFPAHPRTKSIAEILKNKMANNIKIIDPLSYFDMLWLVKNSSLVLTDSEGLQKEAYWLKVPCITLKEQTEWVETVQNGWNILYKNYKGTHKLSSSDELLYGDGKTSEKIVDIIVKTMDVTL